MLLFANIISNIGYLLALVIMATLLLRRSYRYFGRKGKTKIEGLVRIPRPKLSGPWATNVDSPEQVSKFEVQLHETMREMSAQLDSKMICLQVLLRQANEKIAQLEQMQQKLSAGSSDTSARPANSAGTNSNDPADPLRQQILTLADEGFSPVTIAHRVAQPLQAVEAVLRDLAGR